MFDALNSKYYNLDNMFTQTINPIIYEWSFLSIRWYGVLLAAGLIIAFALLVKIFKENNLKTDLALDLAVWLTLGGLVGARLGYILFYNLNFFVANPQEIIFINHGGLSSHGMALGMILGFIIFVKIKKVDWKNIIDLAVIPLPIIVVFIRIGNFINSGIVGRETDLAWGVKFPAYEIFPVARHPVQLYEALAALLIFIFLYIIYKKYYKRLPLLFIFNLFVLLYFSTRFILEFFKEYQVISPEYFLTMGQVLSIPFILWSIGWFVWKYKTRFFR